MLRILVFAATLLLLTAACRRNTPTPVASPTIQTTPTAVSLPPQPTAIEPDPAPASSEPSAVPIEEPAPAPPPISEERILLLAPTSPLIIEFHLTIDGQPHTEALSRLVDEVM